MFLIFRRDFLYFVVLFFVVPVPVLNLLHIRIGVFFCELLAVLKDTGQGRTTEVKRR